MKKSKQQKKLEAEFRKIRGILVEKSRDFINDYNEIIFLKLNDSLLTINDFEYEIYKKNGTLEAFEDIKFYKKLLYNFPIELQIEAFKNWYIEDNIILKKN